MKAILACAAIAAVAVGCVMAGGQETGALQPTEPRVAKVQNLMAGIQEPGMLLLQRSVRGAGPQSDDDWGAVTMNAALMNEIGFMLVQNERAKDAVWTKAATDLRAASAAFHAASEKKDLAAMRAELPKLSASCQECHTVHRK